MEIFEAILTRRSIRKYKKDTIPVSIIENILKAAMYAPSARNAQPWHFMVIDKPAIFEQIMNVHPYSQMLKNASHGIIVCADENLELSKGYWPIDCAAATQNLLLAAHGFGLGAVWLGVYPRENRMKGMREIFKLPGHIQPFSIVSLGYPAEKIVTPMRFKKERIHWNIW